MVERQPARRRGGLPPVGQVRSSDGGTTPGAALSGQRSVDATSTSGARPATLGKRVGAYIIDYLAITVGLAVVGARTGWLTTNAEVLSQDQAYLAGAVSSGVALLYFTLLEATSGQTLAKRLLRIKVVMADGGRATVRAALTRRVLFVAGMLVPVVGALFAFAVPLAALVTAIQDEPIGRGFHDRWAGTVVVEAYRSASAASPNSASR